MSRSCIYVVRPSERRLELIREPAVSGRASIAPRPRAGPSPSPRRPAAFSAARRHGARRCRGAPSAAWPGSIRAARPGSRESAHPAPAPVGQDGAGLVLEGSGSWERSVSASAEPSPGCRHPRRRRREAGPAALLAFAIAFVVALLIALPYAELACRPVAGVAQVAVTGLAVPACWPSSPGACPASTPRASALHALRRRRRAARPLPAFLAFGGVDMIAAAGEEVRRPERTLPRAILHLVRHGARRADAAGARDRRPPHRPALCLPRAGLAAGLAWLALGAGARGPAATAQPPPGSSPTANTAIVAVKPCRKLLPPTGPISPLQKRPAAGMRSSSSAMAVAS